MKSLSTWVYLTVIASIVAAAPAQPATKDVSYRLEIQPSTVKLGAAILGKLVATNTSNHNIDLYVDTSGYAHPSGYTVYVRDAQGKAPGFKPSALVVIGSSASKTLTPGEATEFKVDVTNLYHIDKPGSYSIQVQKRNGKGKILVESTTVTMTVTP